MNDLKFAFRQLLKNPGFTAVAVLTLALGIGANTAIFSVVDAVLLRRLPVDSPDRLVAVHNQLPKVNLPRTEISALQFRDYADRTDVFESAAAITFPNYNLTGTDQPLRLRGMRTTAGLFSVLGVRPVAGRVFTAAEDTYGAQHVVVLSQNVAERIKWSGSSPSTNSSAGPPAPVTRHATTAAASTSVHASAERLGEVPSSAARRTPWSVPSQRR